MADVYNDAARSTRMRAVTWETGPEGVSLQLDGSHHAEVAVDALRELAAEQITAALGELWNDWCDVDQRLLHMLEDTTVKKMREDAEEIAAALRFVEALAPLVDDDSDDDEPEPAPTPTGSETA